MISLHVFGPAFGMVDPSAFVLKAHTLLRMAGIPYETTRATFKNAPKGKYPIIEDDGVIVPDSTLIRFHLEAKHGANFDAGHAADALSAAWAFEKMCEDHLYWAIVHDRWMVDANFDKGPRHIFDSVPAPMRPLIIAMVRRKVRKNLWAQGNGRYDDAERFAITSRGVKALADRLAAHDFIAGATPCGADASTYGTVASLLTTFFDSKLSSYAQGFPSLHAYADRMKARYYADVP
jgi:glutathione S-transferase